MVTFETFVLCLVPRPLPAVAPPAKGRKGVLVIPTLFFSGNFWRGTLVKSPLLLVFLLVWC